MPTKMTEALEALGDLADAGAAIHATPATSCSSGAGTNYPDRARRRAEAEGDLVHPRRGLRRRRDEARTDRAGRRRRARSSCWRRAGPATTRCCRTWPRCARATATSSPSAPRATQQLADHVRARAVRPRRAAAAAAVPDRAAAAAHELRHRRGQAATTSISRATWPRASRSSSRSHRPRLTHIRTPAGARAWSTSAPSRRRRARRSPRAAVRMSRGHAGLAWVVRWRGARAPARQRATCWRSRAWPASLRLKRTSELIPLCHPVRLTGSDVDTGRSTAAARACGSASRRAPSIAPASRWRPWSARRPRP